MQFWGLSISADEVSRVLGGLGGGVLQPEGAECVRGGYRAEQAVRGHSGGLGQGWADVSCLSLERASTLWLGSPRIHL